MTASTSSPDTDKKSKVYALQREDMEIIPLGDEVGEDIEADPPESVIEHAKITAKEHCHGDCVLVVVELDEDDNAGEVLHAVAWIDVLEEVFCVKIGGEVERIDGLDPALVGTYSDQEKPISLLEPLQALSEMLEKQERFLGEYAALEVWTLGENNALFEQKCGVGYVIDLCDEYNFEGMDYLNPDVP